MFIMWFIYKSLMVFALFVCLDTNFQRFRDERRGNRLIFERNSATFDWLLKTWRGGRLNWDNS